MKFWRGQITWNILFTNRQFKGEEEIPLRLELQVAGAFGPILPDGMLPTFWSFLSLC